MLAWAFALVAPIEADEPVRATRQMVVTANPWATEAGLEILRAGGNAVDAAIAIQLVLSMVEPQSSGIGGGAFMLFSPAPEASEDSPRIVVYQGRETAPALATPDMFLDQNGQTIEYRDSAIGGLSVGVPGVLRMLEQAHQENGRLPWPTLFTSAIELAERGFEVSSRLYFLLSQYQQRAEAEYFTQHYYDRNGAPRKVGHLLVNHDYAETLRKLARDGAEVMYSGSLAREIVAAVKGNSIRPGRLALSDMENYVAQRLDPICTLYRQWRICGPRLPSSGGITVQQILGILQEFDVASLGSNVVEAIHIVSEASRLAYADRNLYLADDSFVDVPASLLLSPAYLAERASLIKFGRAMSEPQPGSLSELTAWNFSPSVHSDWTSTSHFSVVDQWGAGVSMTTTIQMVFGSQLMVGGFLLNNQLTDFSYQPERDGKPVANRVESGKRPLSSMSPTMVFDADGRLRVLIGSPGGTRIINYVTQALLGVLDWEMNIQEAIDAPHFLAQTGSIELEDSTDLAQYQDALEALGHEVHTRVLNSGLHGITIDYTATGRLLWGGADPRREGLAMGD
jgi:gamma-glutamyltranspeptidase/glutathione hydrolase